MKERRILYVDDDVHRRLKSVSQSERVTLTELLDGVLRRFLKSRSQYQKRRQNAMG